MRHKRLQLSAILLLFLGLTGVKAQEAIPATGGEANGGGGTASYTIGQVVYTTKTGTNGNSIAQGIQQPFEISVVTSIEQAKDINLSVLAYPNPTTDYLTLKVKNYESNNLSFKLFDINGKLLKTENLMGKETQIEMQNLNPGNYFLKITDNQKEIKVFTIIKN